MSEPRCSELSSAAGESLAATATTAERWLLIEVPGRWPRDVASASSLPDAAREAVVAWLDDTRGSRVLFIRRHTRSPDRHLAFVVETAEARGAVRQVALARLEDLAEVDLDAGGDVVHTPLVLVCGHGSRDACCALKGTAVYNVLASSLADGQIWMSSHHGGHRFAANVLVLPVALHFGRVDPESAPRVVSAALAGRIELDHYRGRTVYAPVVQAAERALRDTEALVDVSDLSVVSVDGMHVRFRAPDGREHAAVVEQASGPSVPASCGTAPEVQTTLRARVVPP